jgi:hypothetical protein
MKLFDVTPYGVPIAIIGMAHMLIFGPILLPGGQGPGGSPLDRDATFARSLHPIMVPCH